MSPFWKVAPFGSEDDKRARERKDDRDERERERVEDRGEREREREGERVEREGERVDREGGGLSDDEVAWVRDGKKRHDHVQWLRTVLRTWLAWIIAFVLGLVAFWDSVKKFVRLMAAGD